MTIKLSKNKQNIRTILIVIFLLFLEAIILFFMFSSFVIYPVVGGIEQNVTVTTYLEIGNTPPEVLNVSVDYGATTISLNANSTKIVNCLGVVRDYNGETDIRVVSAKLFDTVNSSYSSYEDNNSNYYNASCNVSYDFTSFNSYVDDETMVLANCTFNVWYYANPQTWKCTIVANDSSNLQDSNNYTINISELLSIGVPDTINYGTVNATKVSDENITTVLNYGNVRLNLSIRGYAVNEADNLSMNCTLGSSKNISVGYEKYNLTVSNPGDMATLAQFQSLYANLTSNITIKRFNLNYRMNETAHEAFNSTYWRIYVPKGVAGSCSGKVVIGATKAGGS
jgi:hypothetical protein